MSISPAVRVHQVLAAQAGKQREQAQNVPRPARVRFTVQTVGIGESRLAGVSAISFGAYMLEEPSFSWGVTAIDPLAVGELPLCTAIVLAYRRTGSGIWTGADMGFKIESAKFNIRLKFDLTFEGSTLRTTTGAGTGVLQAGPRNNTYNGPTAINIDDL